jgi:hypothetical protein
VYHSDGKSLYLPVKIGNLSGKFTTEVKLIFRSIITMHDDTYYITHILVVVEVILSVIVWCDSNSDTYLMNDFSKTLTTDTEIESVKLISYVVVY